MTEQDFLNCERLILLHGTSPQMGTRPKYVHWWFNVIGNRSGLSQEEIYNLIKNTLRK